MSFDDKLPFLKAWTERYKEKTNLNLHVQNVPVNEVLEDVLSCIDFLNVRLGFLEDLVRKGPIDLRAIQKVDENDK